MIDASIIAEDIDSVIWAKLLVNQRVQRAPRGRGADPCGGGQQPDRQGGRAAHVAGGLRGSPGPRIAAGKVLGVGASALAAGHEAALEEAMHRHGATYASMLQDLERGALTEVDVIDGAVVDKGREQGIPTPDPRRRAGRKSAFC
jgi:2-dehydropantoate 2-reductase